MEIRELNPDEIKVGDTVCVRMLVHYGFRSTYRHFMYMNCVVKRIKLSRNFLETDKGIIRLEDSKIYEPSNATEEETRMAKAFQNAVRSFIALGDLQDINIAKLDDYKLNVLNKKLNDVLDLFGKE